MVQLRRGLLAFFALSALAGQSVVGAANARPPAAGWDLEQDVNAPAACSSSPFMELDAFSIC